MTKVMRFSVHLVALLAALSASAAPTLVGAQNYHAQNRLRLGIEGGGGGDWGNPRGPTIGLFGQAGVQFNDTFALFYQPSLYIHAIGNGDNAPLFLAGGNLAMGDVTIGPLQLGLGGGFDIGRFAKCSGGTCSDCLVKGMLFSVSPVPLRPTTRP